MARSLDTKVRIGIRLAVIATFLIGLTSYYNLDLLLEAADLQTLMEPGQTSIDNRGLLSQRNEAITFAARTTAIVIIILCVAALSLMLLAGRVIGQYMLQRDQAEFALLRENELLDARVRERTEELQKEAAEREKALQAVKKAEEALAIKEERLRLALEAGGMGTWDWNMQTGEIVWAEDFALLFGLEYQQFEDGYEPFLIHAHQEDLPGLIEHLVQARLDPGPISYEYRILRGETIRWVAIRGKVNSEDGQVTRITGVVMDITERKLAEEQRKELLKQMHALTAHLQQIREEERTRIAREIHDELGQALTGMKMELAWVRSRLQKSGETISTSLMTERTQSMSGMIDETIRTVRRIASELRPGVLDELGLAAAIEWLARDFEQRSHIECSVELDDVQIDREPATAMFRVCQEALTNVGRHAQATEVTISLKKNNQEFTLQIQDNGRGITQADQQQTRSLGLLGMRERTSLLSGELSIHGQPGQGTTVTMRLPLNAEPGLRNTE